MQFIKSLVFQPTPQEQQRKCNQLCRKNAREIDRQLRNLQTSEAAAKQHIRDASKRGQRNPSAAKAANADARKLAVELIQVRKQYKRMEASKATLNSVQMQMNEIFGFRKIESSLKQSTSIMKSVNSLVRMPELTRTMSELGQALTKAEVIEEMVDDMVPTGEMIEGVDEEAEEEVDKILTEVLKEKLRPVQTAPLPDLPTHVEDGRKVDELDEDEEEDQALNDRLED